jgi:DNA-binding NarL/FixJ family response regulator
MEADMRPVRVLFGALPAALPTSLVAAIRSQQDIEVVGVASGPTSLLLEAEALRADIVLVAAVGGAPPGIVSHLLDQFPHLRVVAVTSDGRHALVSAMRPHVEHVAVSSPADLVRAMRAMAELDD